QRAEWRSSNADAITDGMGAMVRRYSGESHFLSRALLLPIATRQPVVALVADGDFGRVFAGDCRSGTCPGVASEADLCHGAARHGGHCPGVRQNAPKRYC